MRVTSRGRFSTQWWLWPALSLIVLGAMGAVGWFTASSWGRAFSANLFAELFVAVGVGVVVVAWLQRESAAREQRRKATKAVSILREELLRVQQLTKGLADSKAVPIHPLPMGGWKLISSGPLLDSVPPEFLEDLLTIYSWVENVNVVAERLVDLTLGISQALDTAKANRERLLPYFQEMVQTLLGRLDTLIPNLDKYISQTEER